MSRDRPLNRRASYTVDFEHDGLRWTASWSKDGTGRLLEIFIVCRKAGSAFGIAAHDSAIAASLALQHGCPAETLRTALLRAPDGLPAGVLAHALDLAVAA